MNNKRVAVIGAILENPESSQALFNEVVSKHKTIIRARTGIPLVEEDFAVVSIIVCASVNEINSLTGALGAIPNVSVKTAISKKELL